MSWRVRKLRYCLAITALICGPACGWYAGVWTRATGTPQGNMAASPAPAKKQLRPPPLEPIQFHLIPRSQPTPMSPTLRPPRPQQ